MEISEQYLKGFNNGYLLRKHDPVLAKHIIAGASGPSEYLSGLKDGNKEYERELELKLQQYKAQTKGRKKGRGLGL